MPRYTYECNIYECSDPPRSVELSRPAKDRDLPVKCEGCGFDMPRSLAKISAPTVMERVDQHRNVKQRQNNTERLRKRAKKFFVANELPDLVGKHGQTDAKKYGWVKSDGKVLKPEDLK